MAVKLSKTFIEDKCQARAKPYEVRDDKVRGLILRVQPTGLRSWVVERARGQRRTLQRPYPVTTLEAARQQAQALLSGAVEWDRKLAAARTDTARAFIEGDYRSALLAKKSRNRDTAQVRVDEAVERILRVLGNLADLPLSRITRNALEDLLNKRAAAVSAATVNRDRTGINSVLVYAMKRGVIAENPLATVEHVDEDDDASEKVRYLEKAEARRLLSCLTKRDDDARKARARTLALNQPRNRHLKPIPDGWFCDYLHPWVLVAMNTGCRRGELRKLRWTDVDLSKGSMTVRAATAKSSKTRTVPLNSIALATLKQWRKQNPDALEVFGTVDNKRAMAAIFKKAKITDFRANHDFRHHFASWLVMGGIDLNTVRELLGHADIKTTLRYSHLAPKHKASAVETLAAL